MVCEDTLRFRNLPNELSDVEKEDLLRHFGANQVKVISSQSKQKSTAYAKFESKEMAKNVMLRLHQITVLSSRLCVEYANQSIGEAPPTVRGIENAEKNTKQHFKTFVNKINAWNSLVSFHQPPPPHLKYVYPKPNRATINNIAHALASVPKFYTQVLHLMNKMNLPPPFSDVPDAPHLRQQTQTAERREESSESELESDPENAEKKEIIPMKRTAAQKKGIKRPKFIKPSISSNNPVKSGERAEDVFEKVEYHAQGKIKVNVTTEGFGQQFEKMETDLVETPEENEEVEESKNETETITDEELSANRIPAKDLSVLPVFKNYHPGSPSCRLYVKNVSKTVEIKDLEFIYKRYVEEGTKEDEENQFEIRLMQEGRMKGQAFVTFGTVQSAQRALKDTNGFILKDKPLVVVFARSASSKK